MNERSPPPWRVHCGLARLCAVVLVIICPYRLYAQTVSTDTRPGQNLSEIESSATVTAAIVAPVKKFDIVGLPIPISNPTIGSGLALTGLGIFKSAAEAPPSIVGIGALGTSNGTYGVGLLGKFYLPDYPWRIDASIDGGNVNLDFYGTGLDAGRLDIKIPLSQKVTLIKLAGLRRLGRHVYAGLRYRAVNVDIAPRGNGADIAGFPLPLPDLHVRPRIRSLDLLFEYDSRDNTFFPTRGQRFNVTLAFPDEAFGGTLSYRTLEMDVDGYWSLGNPHWVLAARAALCRVSRNTPFFSACQFGQNGDLRGYVVGRYRDDALFALQTELRWRGPGRFGGVIFAGAGNVGPDLGQLHLTHPLTSVGVGLRFLASRQNHVNVGVDLARAGGEDSLYFRIGEAF